MAETTDAFLAFLRARLNEDERWAQAAARAGSGRWHRGCEETGDGENAFWTVYDSGDPLQVYFADLGSGSSDDARAQHIARHDPARVLREVGAKRRILEEHFLIEGPSAEFKDPKNGDWDAVMVIGCQRCIGCTVTGEEHLTEGPCSTLRALAAVYSDHPDYDEDWKP